MPGLNISYRCCDKKLPLYIRHIEVEAIAGQFRQQLVDATCDRMPQETLASVDHLNVNGIPFELYLDKDNIVHDETNQPVLGICEFDPGTPDAVMVSVSPVSHMANAELVQSTLAHEFGHVVFEAPGWVVSAARGPGLFVDHTNYPYKAHRTTTPDAEHLSSQKVAAKSSNEQLRCIYFAELRANEFMGSLLVPRLQLARGIKELAPKHFVTVSDIPCSDPKFPAFTQQLAADEKFGFCFMKNLQNELAERFGVNRRFIQVRMDRYGYYIQETEWD
uniref:IrrE N-terminal-like domain-containing protein n=1 Tax=Candidatus Nitrotoga fabula TaxID=2182327 RepID=A0A2X0QVU1_9PROT|nr:conserved protein of unknown function [Candidatus Nitrotoga fabula]